MWRTGLDRRKEVIPITFEDRRIKERRDPHRLYANKK